MESCKCNPTYKKLRKGLWSPEEDDKLLNHIIIFGITCWSSVPKDAGLQRCGKSCRLRWMNYLRPDIKRGNFSKQEEDIIITLHKALGNRWSHIASKLPGRTDNEVKNFWNSCLKKKLRQRGIDPVTHKPLKGKDDQNLQTLPREKTQSSLSVKSVFNPFPTFADQAIDQNGLMTVLDDPKKCGTQEISFSSTGNCNWNSNWYNSSSSTTTTTHGGCKVESSSERPAAAVSYEAQHQHMSSDGSCGSGFGSGFVASAWEELAYASFDKSSDQDEGVPFEFDADLFDLLHPNN